MIMPPCLTLMIAYIKIKPVLVEAQCIELRRCGMKQLARLEKNHCERVSRPIAHSRKKVVHYKFANK